MNWYHYCLILYALIVIGGWSSLSVGPCRGWRIIYQLPWNLFYEISCSLADLFPRSPELAGYFAARPRPTLSALAYWSGWGLPINLFMLDPWHCEKSGYV